jgi:cell division protein FtsQ
MKPKPSRKNRFKKNRAAGRSLFRDRAVRTARVVLGSLALLAVSGSFIFAYDYFTQTRQFQVRRVEVTGQQRLSRQQILEIAGIGKRTNILAVNLTTTRKRLLADPWIADATVSREIPSGLRFHIVEEKPLALLDMGSGGHFLINTTGTVFNRVDDPDPSNLPRVEGLNHADLPVAGRPDTKAFKAVMTLFALAGKKNSPAPLSAIRRIRMDRDIGATVIVGQENRAVKLGFGRYPEKVAALEQVMASLGKNGRLNHCRVIDLYDVNRIVITMGASGASGSDEEEV